MALDQNGHEVLDQTPVAVPLGWKRPETLQETVRRLIRGAMSDQAAEQGEETFEEADDFDVGDDYDPTSPWELRSDQEGEAVSEWELRARAAGWNPPQDRWEDQAKANGWVPPQAQPLPGKGAPAGTAGGEPPQAAEAKPVAE